MTTALPDRDICIRAYQSRDARFDGRFFIGVKTTGIFCRPVCPAPSPKAGNVLFYPSAAAAASAGLRPCLRCRPEASPGTPDWNGSAATVARALRLIHEGALDEHSVSSLAGRLNITPRQLLRLFQKHLGASPVKVAQTRRLLFAKQLIDESNLSMAEIAFTAGFGSIRRFNAVFLNTYGHAPASLRRQQVRTDLTLKLAYRPPFDWPGMLAFFRLRQLPSIEQVSEDCYHRSLNLRGQAAMVRISHAPDTHALLLNLIGGDSRQIMTISEACRRVFDLGADPQTIGQHLARDPRLRALVRRNPGLRLPGAWGRFETLIRAILGQQVSVQAATTLADRLVQHCGGKGLAFPNGEAARVFPAPEDILASDLSGLGLTRRRQATLLEVCKTIVEGRLPLDDLMTTDQLYQALLPLPGIGPWTVEYLAMRGLSEPDAFPTADLGLLKATGLSARDLHTEAENWRPWRAYAALHLWHSLT